MPDSAQKTSPKNIVNLNPESSKNGNRSDSVGFSSLLLEELQARIIRLTGQLDDEERKRRNQDNDFTSKKRDLEDEVSQLKRQLAEDNTEVKLSHERELNKVKEIHRIEVQTLRDEIRDLKQDIELKKLRAEFGGKRGVGDRVMDMLEDKGADFLANLIQGIQEMAKTQGVQPQQLGAPEFQQAYTQAQQQTDEPAESQENTSGSEPTTEDPASKTQPPETSVQHPESKGQQPNTSNQNQRTIKKVSEKEMPEAKEAIKNHLLDMALGALTNNNANLGAYATQVRQQISLSRQQGIKLDAKQWAEMAKSLSETAIEREITPERVSKVIQPALDGVKGYSTMLAALDPAKATDLLFNQFNVEATPPVRKLVTKVLTSIQQNI